MMDMQNEAFSKRLLETFRLEAKEHIDNLSQGLLNLKKNSDENTVKEIVETLFREAHSFKGASRSVGISEIEELCKAMEDVFSVYKQSLQRIPPQLIEVMLECNDLLSILSTENEEKRKELKPKVQDLIVALHKKLQKKNGEAPKVLPARPVAHVELKEEVQETEIKTEETIRIAVKKLSTIMHQAEEMLFAKMFAMRHVDELSIIAEEIEELIKPLENGNYDEMLSRLSATGLFIEKSIKQAKADAREINMMVNHLTSDLKEALMLPFSTIFSTLPKVVYDMGRSVGKDITLHVKGGDLQIDRRILEQIHDPLIHLIRNSIDHGILSNGNITLTLIQNSASKVELSIRDDGAGIDIEKIRLATVKKGILDQASVNTLDEAGVLRLIFYSGVSTSAIVTDLSGRGLGLAIVLEKVEQLGGSVEVENIKGGGCEFTMLIPLSLATFRGVITSIGKQKFIFASEHVVRVMLIKSESIKNIEEKEMVIIDQHVVPFYYLSNILELPFVANESSQLSVVVIAFGAEMLAISVDKVLYEEEVMVKALGKQIASAKNITGASLLASNTPALILNISDIFKSVGTIIKKTIPVKEESKKKSKILVVDDSPTTRALLENIIEMVGYDVLTAGDGLEAYELLKKESCDLVVSDVDMPRMNGFELCESIRADEHLSELPIILVTALDSPEDKERGMNVGANAYLVKSAFDQNNLIENIQSLID